MTTLSGIITPTNLVTATSTETLTNKTLTAPIISSISNTGTLTLPTSTDTLVGRATTDTLTNKTLTAPVLTSPNITTALTLAGAAGTNGQVLTSAGSGLPSWTTISSTPTIVRSARTANTILGTADASTLINITSGTFSQTFTAAATLGSGWFCYIQNTGTGDITLDPNGSETIDGLTSYIMYPQECRLVQCTGTAFTSVVLSPFLRKFTATGTFTTPPGYSHFSGLLWGGGGSGTNAGGAAQVAGGGGGACVPFILTATQMSTSQTITIAAGGAGKTTGLAGAAGGSSTIGSLITSYGGGGSVNASAGTGGTGGGMFGTGPAGGSNSTGIAGGEPKRPTPTSSADCDNTLGGGGVFTNSLPGKSVYGGAAGGGANAAGGISIYGGGGGGGSSAGSGSGGAGGVSSFGGSGGAGGNANGVNGVDGTQPAGGGGGASTGTLSGAGGNGQCTIWGIA